MLFINLKNYTLDTHAFLENLSKLYSDKFSKIDLCILPSIIELTEVRKLLPQKIKVYSQSIDVIDESKSTGKISLAKLLQNGITGCMINHSENPKDFGTIERILDSCSKTGIESMIAFKESSELEMIKELPADYFLYEPSGLIGNSYSKNPVSVMESKKNELYEFKNSYPDHKFIIGAGIKSEQDFMEVYKMEFTGIALSSIIAESNSIIDKLEEIMTYENEYGR